MALAVSPAKQPNPWKGASKCEHAWQDTHKKGLLDMQCHTAAGCLPQSHSHNPDGSLLTYVDAGMALTAS